MGTPYAPAIYAPVQRRDGVWIWRLMEKNLLGTLWGKDARIREKGVYSVPKAERLAGEIAADRGLTEWVVVHHRPLTGGEITQFVQAAGMQ